MNLMLFRISVLYSAQLCTYLREKSHIRGGEELVVDWLNSIFCDRCLDQNRNWNVRLSSMEVYLWIECKRCGQRALLNAFLSWHTKTISWILLLHILKSIYSFFLTMFLGDSKVTQQQLSLDQ